MRFFVYGHEPAFTEYLETSIKQTDSITLCSKSDTQKLPEKGDAAIIVTDEISEVTALRDCIAQEVPLAVLSKNPVMLDPIEFPLTRNYCCPLSAFESRKCIDGLRDIISKMILLEEYVAGVSPDATVLRNNIILASSTNVPVHIYGETGTGKTMTAKLIHALGNSGKKLVYINCANLSSSLIDSELFGHSKGAFTDADKARGGLIRKANESTLFLDEIGNLPIKTQAKLLDTIESGKYRSVGDDEEYCSHFRLITASHESLETLLEKRKLRVDFYYRISTLAFTIKPLREHLEDIPCLVRHYEKNNKVKHSQISDYAMLMNQNWKGNVRELHHYLKRIYLFA